MSNAKHYLLFDSSCALCNDVAGSVEKESGGTLQGMSLYAPEAKRMLDQARPNWKFEPTLLEVEGDKVRAYTGMAMRARMVTFLNPLQLLKIARLVQQAGVPLFGSFEAHVPEPPVEPVEAEPEQEAKPALPSGFRLTHDGPEIGTHTPIESVTTMQGKVLRLDSDLNENTLLLFLSTTCPHCHKVAEALAAYAQDAPERVIVIFGATEQAPLDEFLSKHDLSALPIVISPETRLAFGVTGVPYGFALDQSGTVRGKGIVNNDEHLDSLANTFYVSVEALKQALATRGEERVQVS